MNPINALLNALNEIDGIEFALDAWLDKAPNDYGVVEMPGEQTALWADDKMVEQMFRATVHIYVHGGEFGWIEKVQNVLQEQDAWYQMPVREYLDDIHMVHWSWNVRFYGRIEDEEPETEQEVANDG